MTRCAELGHPPVTYNPWEDAMWCNCGEVVRSGQHEKSHAFCCEVTE